MAWRNPVTSLPADDITPGTFTGTYGLVGGRIQTSGFGCYLDGNTGHIGISSGSDVDFDIHTAEVIAAGIGQWTTYFDGANPNGGGGVPVGGAPQIQLISRKSDGSGTSVVGLNADRVATNSAGNVMTGTRGVFSGTTDANGRVVVTHGLGALPATVDGTPAGPDGGTTILGYVLTPQASWTSTTFTARCVSTAGAAIASASVTFSWEVQS